MNRTAHAVFHSTIPPLPASRDMDRIEAIVNIFKGVEEYVLDSTGVIVGSNLEAVTITGYEEWEIIGRHFSIFYSIEDQIKRAFEIDLEKATRQGYCYVSGIKMKKRNSPFWAKMKLTAIWNNENFVSGFRLTIQDATHKAIYSHNLNLVRDEYLNIFNNPFIGIFKFRIIDYKFVLVNEKAETLFGKDWRQRYFDHCFRDLGQFECLISKIRTEKKVENHEVQIIDPSGNHLWVSVSCKLFPSLGSVEGVIMDITDRKLEMERTISLANELEAFIYHASHDLRSPITSIYGLVNLLRKDPEPDKIEKYCNLLDGRLHHLDYILRDIVEIAFNTAVQVQMEQINFETEINSILPAQSKAYPSIAYTVNVNQPEGVDFYTDLTRLRSILRKVVSNAFKYNNPTCEKSYVRINVDVSESACMIVVEDNGIGIQAEYTEKIFSLFYKATESHKGNGLGLYIVKSMVSRLGGEIELDTVPGVGTKFTVKLPNGKPGKTSGRVSDTLL